MWNRCSINQSKCFCASMSKSVRSWMNMVLDKATLACQVPLLNKHLRKDLKWLNYTSCWWNILLIQSCNCSTAPASYTSCCIHWSWLNIVTHSWRGVSRMKAIWEWFNNCGSHAFQATNIMQSAMSLLWNIDTCKPFAANASDEKKKAVTCVIITVTCVNILSCFYTIIVSFFYKP